MFTSGLLFASLFVASIGILAVMFFVHRSNGHKMHFGDSAKTLAWIAGSEFVLGLLVAVPFSAPTHDGVWQMMLASLITVIFAGSAWLLHLDALTPAVVHSRARRAELHRQLQH